MAEKLNYSQFLTKRRVGLEFEHISKLSHPELARQLIDAGVIVDAYATGHPRCPQGCYSGWQVKTDGSITPHGDFPRGIELVSPPFYLSQSGQVKKALAIAGKHGGVNSSCGLHVHVEAPELIGVSGNPNQLRRLQNVWSAIENTMFSYVTPARRHGSYCRRGISPGNRYQACNIEPLDGGRSTIEFRLHNPTLNYRKALSFAALCVSICEYIVRGSVTDRVPAIDPAFYANPPPHKIRTRVGREFILHRIDKKWIVEGKHEALEGDDLRLLWEQHGKQLSLSPRFHLIAWKYPQYGNAMTELCKLVSLDGPFRGYLEDRYDRVVRKFGIMGRQAPAADEATLALDEADYYNEPDYVEQEAQ